MSGKKNKSSQWEIKSEPKPLEDKNSFTMRDDSEMKHLSSAKQVIYKMKMAMNEYRPKNARNIIHINE
jgi:hypothetical protein